MRQQLDREPNNDYFDDRTFTTYGAPFGQGDVIGCLLDRCDQTIRFAKNGTSFGIAFSLPPALHGVPLKPAACGKNFHVRLNTSSTMVYPILGFVPIGSIDPNHTSSGLARGNQQKLIKKILIGTCSSFHGHQFHHHVRVGSWRSWQTKATLPHSRTYKGSCTTNLQLHGPFREISSVTKYPNWSVRWGR